MCAFIEIGDWFQLSIDREDVHITTKELLPIVVTCVMWVICWQGCTIQCSCDNVAVVVIGSSVILSFFMAHSQIMMAPSHILGRLNEEADYLSRDNLFSPDNARYQGSFNTSQRRTDGGAGDAAGRLESFAVANPSHTDQERTAFSASASCRVYLHCRCGWQKPVRGHAAMKISFIIAPAPGGGRVSTNKRPRLPITPALLS